MIFGDAIIEMRKGRAAARTHWKKDVTWPQMWLELCENGTELRLHLIGNVCAPWILNAKDMSAKDWVAFDLNDFGKRS